MTKRVALFLSLVLFWSFVPYASAQTERVNGNRQIDGWLNYCAPTSNSATAYACSPTVAATGYVAGARYTFKADVANTGAATFNLSSLGAKTIKKWLGTSKADLIAGEIQAGQDVELIYDGTDMQMVSLPANVTKTIASGTKALATSAISSGTCTSAQTATATGTLTTDVVLAGFNGDVTGVTGYTPDTTGTLRIDAYPTADTVNFKVCNSTSSSITPGAITLNWRVVR